MISEQEGGTNRGRLLLPRDRRIGRPEISSPSLPGSLWLLCPGGEPLLPDSGLSGSRGKRRGAAGAETPPNTAILFKYRAPLWRPIGRRGALRHCFPKTQPK